MKPTGTADPKTIYNGGFIIENGNSLNASFSPRFLAEFASLASLGTKTDVLLVERNKLIECLIKKESSNNPSAYNPEDPNGGSFGILQYQIFTFEEFCVNKYGFPNEIMDPEIQIKCAEKMIFEDGQIKRWTTASSCLPSFSK